MIASYYLIEEADEEKDLYCTTSIPGEKTSQKLKDMYNVLFKNPFFMSMTIIKE